ncbi:MAG: alpha/beta hydrolase [Acidimicrobiales bacterium]
MNEQTHIDIGSSQLGYRKLGDGPDIVFIHGWPLHRETWRHVAAALPNYTCHLIDLPGSGASITPAATKVSLRGHVDAVVEAIEVLDLDEIVLVGQDSGGMVARFAMDRIGDSVSALILAGTEIPHHHPAVIDRLQMAAKLPGSASITARLMNTPRIVRSKQVLGGCFFDRDLIEGDFRTEVLDQTFRDKSVVKRQLEVLASYTSDVVDELAEVHPKIMCPTLLVWGKGDPFFPVGKARKMVEQFGGPTRFEVFDDARLLAHEEHPKRFAALCAEFLVDPKTRSSG